MSSTKKRNAEQTRDFDSETELWRIAASAILTQYIRTAFEPSVERMTAKGFRQIEDTVEKVADHITRMVLTG